MNLINKVLCDVDFNSTKPGYAFNCISLFRRLVI